MELDRSQLRTTVISRFELLGGAKTGPQQKLVGELLAALPCLSLDEPAADRAADIRRSLERDGPFRLQGCQKNVLSAPMTVKASSTR